MALLAAFPLAGCGGSEQVESAEDDAQGKAKSRQGLWNQRFVLTSVAGNGPGDQSPIAQPRDFRLSFGSERKRYVGFYGGCNGHGGDVRITATKLKVGGLGSTLIGCGAKPEGEDVWLARFLEGDPEWHLEGERLRLVSSDGVVELQRLEDPASEQE